MSKKDIYMPEHLIRDNDGNVIGREDITLVTEDYSVKTADGTLDKSLEKIDENCNNKWGKDKLELGGRNLVIDSKSFKKGNSNTSITSNIVDGMLQVEKEAESGGWHADWEGDNFNPEHVESHLNDGDDFTFSLIIRGIGDFKGKPTVYFKSDLGYYKLAGEISEDWRTLTYTGKWVSEKKINMHLAWGTGSYGKFQIKAWKIEKGAIPTKWTPAPEDLDGKHTQSSPLANMEHIEHLTNEVRELREMIAKRGLSR